jgi:hypothetical protein
MSGGGVGAGSDGDMPVPTLSAGWKGEEEGVLSGVWDDMRGGARQCFLKWLGIRGEDMLGDSDLGFRRRVCATLVGSGAAAHSPNVCPTSSLSKSSVDNGRARKRVLVIGASCLCLCFALSSATCDGGGTGDL